MIKQLSDKKRHCLQSCQSSNSLREGGGGGGGTCVVPCKWNCLAKCRPLRSREAKRRMFTSHAKWNHNKPTADMRRVHSWGCTPASQEPAPVPGKCSMATMWLCVCSDCFPERRAKTMSGMELRRPRPTKIGRSWSLKRKNKSKHS